MTLAEQLAPLIQQNAVLRIELEQLEAQRQEEIARAEYTARLAAARLHAETALLNDVTDRVTAFVPKFLERFNLEWTDETNRAIWICDVLNELDKWDVSTVLKNFPEEPPSKLSGDGVITAFFIALPASVYFKIIRIFTGLGNVPKQSHVYRKVFWRVANEIKRKGLIS